MLLESATRQRDARLRDPDAAEIHPHDVSDADRGVVEDVLAEARGEAQPAEAFDFDAAFAAAEDRRLAELAASRANIQDIRRQDSSADAIAGVDLDAAHARYLEQQQRQAGPAGGRPEIQDIRRQDQSGTPAATNAGGFDFDAGMARAQTPPADYEEPPQRPEDLRRFHFDYVRVVGSQPSGDVQRDLATYREARRRSASQSASQPGSRSGPGSPPSGRSSGGRPRSANNEAAGLMTGGGRSRPQGRRKTSPR